jgi:hypothetical protein
MAVMPFLSQSQNIRSLLLGACSVFFVSCQANVVSVGPDTYSASSSGAGFSDVGQREKVYGAANDFCAKRGLVMVPVSMDAKNGIVFTRPPSASLVFRALKPGDPEIKRPTSAQVQGL